MEKGLMIKQLFEKESSTYTYLVWDANSKEAIIIDPVKETFQRDMKLIKELGLKLLYVLDTHIHADHITSSHSFREELGAKIVLGSATKLERADILLDDSDELEFGESFKIKVIATPGHTNGCTSYLLDNMIFTGDALLIHSVGRCDFQEGNAKTLFNSVRNKLFNLSDDTIVYPAHNYEGISNTSIGEEKLLNNFLRVELSEEESVELMENRDLPLPKKIKESIPANMNLGIENN